MSRRLSTVRAALSIAIGAFLLTGMAMTIGAMSVDAQITCDAGISTYQVSTSAELNAAIICHNQSTAELSDIFMLNDIAADTVTETAVFEPVTRGALNVTGTPTFEGDGAAGAKLSRSETAGSALLPLFVGGASTNVWLRSLELEMGPFDTVGIQGGRVGLGAAAIISDGPHPGAVAVSANVDATIIYSYIQGVPTGVDVDQTVPSDNSSLVTDDGTVDNADVQALLDWLAGGDEPANLGAGDIVSNGTVNLNDALALAQLID